jgi:hypothetical protein
MLSKSLSILRKELKIMYRKLTTETVARIENCSFLRFHPFASFEIIENNVQLHINAREDGKVYMGRKSVWHNGEIIAICETYRASVGDHFVSK